MGTERQDCCSYDELRILAEDARRRRRRTNIWTTALIAGAMVVTGLYVGTMGEEVDALNDVQTENDDLKNRIVELQRDREVLRVERDLYRKAADWLHGDRTQPITGELTINNRVLPSDDPAVTPEAQLRDIVWLVEGSRQVPMTTGDFLWIPESNSWLEMRSLESGAVRIHFDRERTTFVDDTLPVQLSVHGLNAANYVCIQLLDGNSTRSNFRTDHRDVDIRFQDGPCPERFRVISREPQPMAVGEFRWIPEANAGIRLTDDDGNGEVTVYFDRGQTVSVDADLPLQLSLANSESANYACVELLQPEPGESQIHLRFQNHSCEDGAPITLPAVPMITGDYRWIPEVNAGFEIFRVGSGGTDVDVRVFFERHRAATSREAKLPIQLQLNNPDGADSRTVACISAVPASGAPERISANIALQNSDCGAGFETVPRGQQ